MKQLAQELQRIDVERRQTVVELNAAAVTGRYEQSKGDKERRQQRFLQCARKCPVDRPTFGGLLFHE